MHKNVSNEKICTPERPSCWEVERKDYFLSIRVNFLSEEVQLLRSKTPGPDASHMLLVVFRPVVKKHAGSLLAPSGLAICEQGKLHFRNHLCFYALKSFSQALMQSRSPGNDKQLGGWVIVLVSCKVNCCFSSEHEWSLMF